MLRRVIDGIFYPSEVIKYRSDRKLLTFGVIIIYALLLMIPSIIQIVSNDTFSYQTKVAIRNSFFNNTEIPYVIEDGKLVFVGTTEKPQYYVNIDEINTTIVFTTQEEILYDKKMNSNIIVFNSKCVYLNNGIQNLTLLYYYEYNNCSNLDFRLAKVDDKMFWNQMFSVVHSVLDNYQDLIFVASLLIIITQSIGMILLITTFLTLFNRLGSQNIYSFGIHWKLMLYYSGPFVLGSLLAILFNIRLIEYVGILFTIIYSFRINNSSFIKGE